MAAIVGKSAIFRRGKLAVFEFFLQRYLIDCSKVFEQIDSSPQTVITKGIRFPFALWSAKKRLLV